MTSSSVMMQSPGPGWQVEGRGVEEEPTHRLSPFVRHMPLMHLRLRVKYSADVQEAVSHVMITAAELRGLWHQLTFHCLSSFSFLFNP